MVYVPLYTPGQKRTGVYVPHGGTAPGMWRPMLAKESCQVGKRWQVEVRDLFLIIIRTAGLLQVDLLQRGEPSEYEQ